MTTPLISRTNRRRFVASSALGGAAILTAGQVSPFGNRAGAPAVLAQDSSSSDVPMFRGNAARTGEMPGPGPDDSRGVEVIWQFPAVGGFSSPPAIVAGIVYAGSVESNLYALNAEDGTERWRFATGGSMGDSSPAVVDGVVYVGGGDGNLYAVNADDATEYWRFDNGSSNTSPAVVDGVVFVGGRALYALDAADGTERWRFDIGITIHGATPAVADGVVYIGSQFLNGSGGECYLFALSAEDGTERWQFAVGREIRSTPAVADSVVYVNGADANLYALNADDGTERWRFEGAELDSSPSVVDGTVYICGPRLLYALNADDGTERWRFMVDSRIASSPAVVNGVVYLNDEEGSLNAVNADDATERWRLLIGDNWMRSSPVVVGGVVYVGSGDLSWQSEVALYAIGARGPRLSVGGTARVTEKTPLRGGPAPTAVERAELDTDTVVTITGEAETAGDATWWPVVVDATGDQGWVKASALEPLTSGPEPTAPV